SASSLARSGGAGFCPAWGGVFLWPINFRQAGNFSRAWRFRSHPVDGGHGIFPAAAARGQSNCARSAGGIVRPAACERWRVAHLARERTLHRALQVRTFAALPASLVLSYATVRT